LFQAIKQILNVLAYHIEPKLSSHLNRFVKTSSLYFTNLQLTVCLGIFLLISSLTLNQIIHKVYIQHDINLINNHKVQNNSNLLPQNLFYQLSSITVLLTTDYDFSYQMPSLKNLSIYSCLFTSNFLQLFYL